VPSKVPCPRDPPLVPTRLARPAPGPSRTCSARRAAEVEPDFGDTPTLRHDPEP